MPLAPIRTLLPLAALLASPACAFAQATAMAGASTQIVEPAGVVQAAAGSSATAAVNGGQGVAQLSGGSFAIQGPANQVVSVTATLPAQVERVGGGAPLPVKGSSTTDSRILTPAGAASFDVAGAASVGGASGGLYAGQAMVLVNLN